MRNNKIKKILIYILLIISLFLYISLHTGVVSSITKNNGINSFIWVDNKIKSINCYSGARVTVLMYHYIREHDPLDDTIVRDLSVIPAEFEKHMDFIEKLAIQKRITLMQGSEFFMALKNNCYPSKNIVLLSSDDGWGDTFDSLFPIASKYHIPFFLGIISSKIDVKGFVSWEHILEIIKNPLFTISSHSIHHLDQDKLSPEAEKTEICESKKTLENLTHQPINSYIFPSGRMSSSSSNILKECWYTIAWSTWYGHTYWTLTGSVYDMNRVRIHSSTTVEDLEGILFPKISKKNTNTIP